MGKGASVDAVAGQVLIYSTGDGCAAGGGWWLVVSGLRLLYNIIYI